MSIVGEPIPGQAPAQGENEAKNRALELIELEKKTPGLGAFIHFLEASNRVRDDIDGGKLDNLSSGQAFEQIWKTHVGDSVEEHALAYTEPGGVLVDDLLDALRQGIRPPGLKGSVRIFEGSPLLFDIPKSLKPQVSKLFFELADKIIHAPDNVGGFAYLPAVELQSHLDFVHLKEDAVGRTSEDWMLWWQQQLVRKSEKQVAKEASTSFLGLPIAAAPTIAADSIRTWSYNGLRAGYFSTEGDLAAPPFLQDEFRELYIQGRKLMHSRRFEMREFRKAMYEFLSEKLGYQGEPKNFESFVNEHVEETAEVFRELYSSRDSLDRFTNSLRFGEMYWLLANTGEYSYQVLQPKDVIKPNYLLIS